MSDTESHEEPTPNRCPKCGSEIPANAPGALCPKCLLLGAERGAGDDGARTTTARATAAARSWTPPTVGELATAIPGYEIEALIGRGGMGAVYRARQAELDRQVAIKVLPKELGDVEGFAERFRREAQVLARLDHPNIVRVIDFGRSGGGHFFLVMEYVDGLDLQRAIRSGEVGEKEALAIVAQVCDALQYAHGQGFVHRDIKPANLLVTREGTVKVGDFGIARVLGETGGDPLLTAEGQGLGTLVYAAPEQLSGAGAVDHRADIYSLGVVLYEMLTGEVPRGAFDLPSERVSVDVRLDEVVVRAMKSSPERRYQAAREVKADVDTIAGTTADPGPGRAVPPVPATAAAGAAAAPEPGAVAEVQRAGGATGKGRTWSWGCFVAAAVLGLALLAVAVPVVLWISYQRAAAEKDHMVAREVAATEHARAETIARLAEADRQKREGWRDLMARATTAAGEERHDQVRKLVYEALQHWDESPDLHAEATQLYRAIGDDELARAAALRFMDRAPREHPRWSEIDAFLNGGPTPDPEPAPGPRPAAPPQVERGTRPAPAPDPAPSGDAGSGPVPDRRPPDPPASR